ncbi:acyl-CoA desaturase, partial [Thiolapillus sp.]
IGCQRPSRFWGLGCPKIYHEAEDTLVSLILVFVSGFSLTALLCFLVLYFTRLWAIAGGYHRYFSHRSYETSRWFQFMLAFTGSTAGQKGPLSWATSHNRHHRHSDREGDPHSPVLQDGFHAHLGWLLEKDALPTDKKLEQAYADFPEILFLNRHHYIGTLSLIAALLLLGRFLSAHYPELGTSALQLVSWGFILSTLLILHGTCLVNSVAHMVGSRRFETSDNSRNVWWLFPFMWGENWHNNNHRYPRSASASCSWWEVDGIYLGIRLLEKLGLVWNLHKPRVAPEN